MSKLLRTSWGNRTYYITNGTLTVGVILVFIAFLVVAIYAFWWVTKMHMKIFQMLFGNGWYYIYLGLAGLVLSILNIPLFKTRERDTVYVNVGGCIIPVIVTTYLFTKYNSLLNLQFLVIAILATIVVSRIVSLYVAGRGVLIVSIVVELVSMALAIKLNPELLNRLAFGYIIATVGVIVGGDLLHIGMIGKDGRWHDKLSIGGAGTKDGVWKIGIATMFYILLARTFFGW